MNIQLLGSLISQTLVYSAPLILTALGGVFSERSGIVNVGLEGIMVTGAFSSVIFNLSFANHFGAFTPWLGVLVGGIIGLLFSLLHAVATINFRADHVISGTVMNLLAPPLTIFLIKVMYGKGQTDTIQEQFGYFDFPGLSKIPIIGDLFFSKTSLPAYFAIVVALAAWFIIYKTKFGLRLRSVGENPQAADTLGINVYATLCRSNDFRLSWRYGRCCICPINCRPFRDNDDRRTRIYFTGSDDLWKMESTRGYGCSDVLWFCSKFEYRWSESTGYFADSRCLFTIGSLCINNPCISCLLG